MFGIWARTRRISYFFVHDTSRRDDALIPVAKFNSVLTCFRNKMLGVIGEYRVSQKSMSVGAAWKLKRARIFEFFFIRGCTPSAVARKLRKLFDLAQCKNGKRARKAMPSKRRCLAAQFPPLNGAGNDTQPPCHAEK